MPSVGPAPCPARLRLADDRHVRQATGTFARRGKRTLRGGLRTGPRGRMPGCTRRARVACGSVSGSDLDVAGLDGLGLGDGDGQHAAGEGGVDALGLDIGGQQGPVLEPAGAAGTAA